MLNRTALLQSVLFTDPSYTINAIVDSLDNSKLATRWRLDLTIETQQAIENMILCRSTVEQVQTYLDTRIVETLQTINGVTGFTVDKITL